MQQRTKHAEENNNGFKFNTEKQTFESRFRNYSCYLDIHIYANEVSSNVIFSKLICYHFAAWRIVYFVW